MNLNDLEYNIITKVRAQNYSAEELTNKYEDAFDVIQISSKFTGGALQERYSAQNFHFVRHLKVLVSWLLVWSVLIYLFYRFLIPRLWPDLPTLKIGCRIQY